ncbi:MAG: zinc metallopeptidase [Planctomycetota bacterium]|nr:zinc metallopeptidase [Planctomycetota bacterium]
MRWQGERRSQNVEDRRGASGPRMPGRGMIGGGLGLVAVIVVVMLAGGDPSSLIGMLGGGGDPTVDSGAPRQRTAADDQQAEFVAAVLATTEDVWHGILPGYVEPGLVLFDDAVESACGTQSAAVGPFYCPGDSKVYLDLGFFRQLDRDLGAPGDFAQAYVIAHEVGHHVQNLLGTSRQVHDAERGLGEAEKNALSVRLELQADFYAGVWAHHAQKAKDLLEQGDLDEALRAASRIGDDVLQKRAQGRVSPDSFTHGTAEQRARWFKKGFDTGDVRQGDTFAAKQL